jgi:hypothetical protein
MFLPCQVEVVMKMIPEENNNNNNNNKPIEPNYTKIVAQFIDNCMAV